MGQGRRDCDYQQGTQLGRQDRATLCTRRDRRRPAHHGRQTRTRPRCAHRIPPAALAGRLRQRRPARPGPEGPRLSRQRANGPAAHPDLARHRNAAGCRHRDCAETTAGHQLDHPPAADGADQEQADLARILERCPILRAADRLVADFGGMLRDLRGQHLDAWITNARASGISQLAGFASGLLEDYDAVRNGLTLACSSGAVEGTVCKVKALKRQMFGRAGFDLLRRRILLGN
ncbi:transposase [Amycolatopsis sp. NPDC059090]|uniref:transposase n=1 Tax=Amycolatopsis sp. NPDC059090 TaxID=3346723 RepID=UPI00366D9381